MTAKFPGRILVVDDERSARLLLERVLGRAGHEVTLVESGEEALSVLASKTFDVVISDKNLPGIDGLEVVRLARAEHPGLQAIVITGFPTPETKSTAEGLSVVAYVTKPFGILDILGSCDAAVQKARSYAREK